MIGACATDPAPHQRLLINLIDLICAHGNLDLIVPFMGTPLLDIFLSLLAVSRTRLNPLRTYSDSV